DEIDAIAGKRSEESSDLENRIVCSLCGLMDEISQNVNSRMIVIGATNRPDALDPALRRTGRFDFEIEIGIPTAKDRQEILSVLLANVPHSLTFEEIFQIANFSTYGFVGADLAAVVREAVLNAMK